ncbi:MAG: DUF996 domain-containing protein [Nitrososphaeria archaeon]|jgi:uncharacterized membrane protein
MPINFNRNKIYSGVGAILIAMGLLIPVVGIIGIVVLLIGLRELSYYYQDIDMLRNTFYGFIFGILSSFFFTLITLAHIPALLFSIISELLSNPTELTKEFASSIFFVLIGIILIMFLLFFFENIFFKRTFNALASRTGVKSFRTGGLLLLIGSVLIIFLIGFIILLVAWLMIAGASFFLKPSPEIKK